MMSYLARSRGHTNRSTSAFPLGQDHFRSTAANSLVFVFLHTVYKEGNNVHELNHMLIRIILSITILLFDEEYLKPFFLYTNLILKLETIFQK